MDMNMLGKCWTVKPKKVFGPLLHLSVKRMSLMPRKSIASKAPVTTWSVSRIPAVESICGLTGGEAGGIDEHVTLEVLFGRPDSIVCDTLDRGFDQVHESDVGLIVGFVVESLHR